MIVKGDLQARRATSPDGKVGRRILVERAELDRWADEQPITGRQPA